MNASSIPSTNLAELIALACPCCQRRWSRCANSWWIAFRRAASARRSSITTLSMVHKLIQQPWPLEGEGEILFISSATMQRVQRWIAIAGLERGFLFRSIPHIPKRAAAQGEERYPAPLTDGDVAPAQDLLARNFSAR